MKVFNDISAAVAGQPPSLAFLMFEGPDLDSILIRTPCKALLALAEELQMLLSTKNRKFSITFESAKGSDSDPAEPREPGYLELHDGVVRHQKGYGAVAVLSKERARQVMFMLRSLAEDVLTNEDNLRDEAREEDPGESLSSVRK